MWFYFYQCFLDDLVEIYNILVYLMTVSLEDIKW